MGFASAGGFLKLDLRDSIGDCADRGDVAGLNKIATTRRACGNLEEKGGMVCGLLLLCGDACVYDGAVEDWCG
jgi:hypothetical protein